MKGPLFPSALHRSTGECDLKVLRWAWQSGLFESHAELERFRVEKINWFAGFLYPEIDAEKLTLVMQFFLGLFLLDDLLDQDPSLSHMDYLEGLSRSSMNKDKGRKERIGNRLLELKEKLKNSFPEENSKREWEGSWKEYLNGLQWEIRNKIEGKIPDLEDYKYFRPYSSGVFLAIQLARTKKHFKNCETGILESTIARYICLSNDLVSLSKEKKANDFYNELIILQASFGRDAEAIAKKELGVLEEKIVSLSRLVTENDESCQTWINRLLHLVGGCLAWSAMTVRYFSPVNGKPTLLT
ncbi:hypothetical protein CLV31_109159 [Algoriphagus aquaeductus]|uniref:Terpene synthase n=1 Tax=Algoriphagus aquaeductus TaxID=475299 RepID=A0A326RN43_9BACT|nr:terpene synthase family protein [Algoriphagus aquaeductus]PZV82298.1 hypothetical protein CLV31_109159 [Algoriphagus aquaeductus]